MSSTINSVSQDEASDGDKYVSIHNLSKSFRHVQALNDVTIEIGKNEVVGLVGENGAGKSTLLNILTGIYSPDEGEIEIDGELVSFANPQDAANQGISLVQQEQSIVPNLTGLENLFMGSYNDFTRFGGINKKKMKSEGVDFVNQLGMSIPLSKKVNDYSFDQRQMLEIARAFYIALNAGVYPVILLDEPTAGLEEEGRNVLFNRIRDLKQEASFVFISHELDEVLTICDRIYVLKDGELVTEVLAENTTPDELQQKMVGRTTSEEYYATDDQIPETELGAVTLQVTELSSGDTGPISFEVREGEIFGIVGVEGSGKETVGRMLAGVIPPESGSLTVDGNVVTDHTVKSHIAAGIGYIPKDRKAEGLLLYQDLTLNSMLPTIRTLRGHLPITDRGQEKQFTKNIIDELDIKTPGLDEQVVNLSGGNQQKIVLGRWLQRDLPIFVMDNVTRGLDVGVKEEVYQICRDLSADGTTIVFIGDELPEVINMANRIGIMKNGKLAEIIDAPAENKPTEKEIVQEMI